MAASSVNSSTQDVKDLTTVSKGIQQCETNVIFEDVSPKTDQTQPAPKPEMAGGDEKLAVISPYPDQTPKAILSKEYQIAAFDIDSTWTGEVFGFPDSLFAIDAIDRVISMYRYFKAGIQLDVRITPSIYHQGTLMICSAPGYVIPDPITETIYRLSAFSPVVLSYSTQQQATVTMNWNSPFPYYDTTLETGGTDWCENQIGTIAMVPLTPYRDLSSTGKFTARVFAKFVNPHVAAPLNITSTFLTRKQRKKVPKHHSTPGVGKKPAPVVDIEDLVKTRDSTMVSTAQKSGISPVMDVLGEGMNIVKSFGGILGLFDKPTSSTAGNICEMRVGRDFTQTTGLDYSQRLSQYPSSNLASVKMHNAQYTSHSSIAAIAQVPMLHHMAHIEQGSTPSTSFYLLIHPAETASTSYAAGQFDYLAYISRVCKLWRGSIKYYVKFICPVFNKARMKISVSFDGSSITTDLGDLFSRVVEISGDTDVTFTVPYLFNRFWDNTDIVGYGTPYLTVQLLDNITGGPSGATPIIDVLVFRAAGDDICFSNLCQAHTNPPTALTSTTVLSKTTPTLTTMTQTVPEHQSAIRTEFSKPFESIVCGCSLSYDKNYCTADHLTSVQEVLKRYSELHNLNSTGTPLNDILVWPTSKASLPIDANLWINAGLLVQSNLPSANQRLAFQYLLSLFLYVRGDIRVRLLDKSESTGMVYACLLDSSGNLSSSNSMTFSDLHVSPELSFEVPYSSMIPWHPIQGPIPCVNLYNAALAPHFGVQNGSGTGFTSSYNMYVAASDNFLAGILMPPPKVWPHTTSIRVNRIRKSSSLRGTASKNLTS